MSDVTTAPHQSRVETGFAVRVLGFRAGRPDAGSPCSGYLVEHAGRTVLVDCGPGVLAELLRLGRDRDLDAVVLTHVHQDHMLDVVPLAFSRLLAGEPLPRIPLWLPAESLDFLARLDELMAVPTDPLVGRPLATAFEIRPLTRDGATAVGVLDGLTLTAFPARHAVPSACLRFTGDDGVIAFSSDTGWCDGALTAARGADVFVCETTYLAAEESRLAEHGHLTAELTGRLAAEAGVRHLVVSHLLGWDDDQRCFEVARAAASGVETVSLARVGLRVTAS